MITHNCSHWACGKYRSHAQWEGTSTIHCAQCGELFLSSYAYDQHLAVNAEGIIQCFNLSTFKTNDGIPIFDKIIEPQWEPSYAWSYTIKLDNVLKF